MPIQRIGRLLGIHKEKIAEYKQYHVKIWPQVEQALKEANLHNMSIFLHQEELFCYMEFHYENNFEQEYEQAMGKYMSYEIVQKWEALMRTFQKQLPDAKADQWWTPMEQIFFLQ